MKRRSKYPPEMTTHSVIQNALRQLWLRSRERRAALKRDGYTCQVCKRKQSKAKGKEFSVQVDHLDGEINWAEIVKYVREHLLVDPARLETICKEDHEARTAERRQIEGLRREMGLK
jgi:5-methylcytosine-specific restriction endonuclease McrA